MSSRSLPSFGGLIKLVLLCAVVALLVVGVARIPGMVGDKVSDFLSSLNPFEEETIDRTGPSVLQSLTELSEFRAASAYYETVVDIENDTENLPGFLSGERVLYIGKGNVDAFVDFSELDERRIVVSEDGTTATVTLPAPTVDVPVLNLETSGIYDREAGLITRFQQSDLEREAQLRAVEQMTVAATGEDMLIEKAKESTTAMLRGMLGALGYTNVTVSFDTTTSQ